MNFLKSLAHAKNYYHTQLFGIPWPRAIPTESAKAVKKLCMYKSCFYFENIAVPWRWLSSPSRGGLA